VKIRKIFVNCQERLDIDLSDDENIHTDGVEVINMDGLEDTDE